MEEPAPLSLELRTIKKRQRIRGGIACLVVGVVVLGVSVVFFLQSGNAALLGIWALAAGLGLCGVGGYMLRKAATRRW
jgi:hypothetical protein